MTRFQMMVRLIICIFAGLGAASVVATLDIDAIWTGLAGSIAFTVALTLLDKPAAN